MKFLFTKDISLTYGGKPKVKVDLGIPAHRHTYCREMPQEFQVLRCYQCSTFQVHQVKKAKKWSCKMCGEKQSVIKVFGRGVAADCRRHVQKLNSLRGEIEQVTFESSPSYTSQEQSELSHQQMTEDNNPSVDRWSRFVTPYEEEGDAEDDENDDMFTTDMAELRQKQMTRKRKRYQRDNDCEDDSSDHSQFIYGRSQIQDRRQIQIDDSPEGSSTDMRGRKGNINHLENKTFIQEYKSPSQARYPSVNSVCSVKDDNEGQGHWSNLGGNVTIHHSGYHGNQRDALPGDRPGPAANTGQGYGNYQGMNKVQILNKCQTHHKVQDTDQGLNNGQVHLDGMKKNRNASKWSKYKNDSDSSEETYTFKEQSINGIDICEKGHNQNLNADKGKALGIATSVQSKFKGSTETTRGFSVQEGRLKDFVNARSSTVKLTSHDEMWRESVTSKTCIGRACPEERVGVLGSRFIEGKGNRCRGDNSNSITGLEDKQGNTDKFNSVNQDSFASTRNPNYKSHYQTSSEPLTSCSESFHNSYITEQDITPSTELSSLSHLTRCNQGMGHSEHVVSQKSTSLQSMFVTEDITDEDLLL
ncbi:uncharacterized protein LOC117316536 [Pecten maximus]|uniref:uncharacterized protein LOC117316536 n=1 Tax=Pecten maximus TaxID=6579 RepID=UPI001458406C|nr:uncharacterized protein LOC117316536 [Pecten maximus]